MYVSLFVEVDVNCAGRSRMFVLMYCVDGGIVCLSELRMTVCRENGLA